MNIKGGALEFDIIANNGQINSALEETKKRVQGFSDATVEGGAKMEAAYQEAAATIEKAYRDIDKMINIHSAAIQDLEAEYSRLGEAAATAFAKGTAKGDEEYRALTQKQNAIKAEIATRKELLKEVYDTGDALSAEEKRLQENKKKVEENSNSRKKLTTQIRLMQEELARMEQAGLRDSAAYNKLRAELGRLTDAMSDARMQAKIMANDYAGLQSIISMIGGISGAFSVAQGTVALFAGENENLQKIMLKVQSLMAITIGLQQVANTLNKDSYFRIIALAKAKQILATSTLFLGKAFIKMGLSATASKIAVAGLYATLTLGLSLAITGIVHLINKHNEKQEEAKKKAEEANEVYKKQQKRLDELAKSYAEQVATITTLRNALDRETLSYNDKLKIIKKLQEIIPDYNAKLSKEGRVIWDNKAAIDAYLLSLEKTLRFKAAMEDLTEVYKEIYKIEKNQGKQSDIYKTGEINGQKFQVVDYDKLAQKHGLKNATDVSPDILATWLKMEEGLTQISTDMNNKRLGELKGQVADIQKYVTENNLIDLTTGSKDKGTPKDPFTEQLEKRKQQYAQYYKWVNSKDEIIQKAAKTEFAGLLAQGNSYLDYLNKQREQLIQKIGSGEATKQQAENLKKLNNAIANETKETVLGEFEKELQNQLNGARSIVEMLDILEARRKQLSGDGSDIDSGKKDILDKEQENVAQKAKEETDNLLNQYSDYINKRINKTIAFESQMQLLRQRAAKAETEDERKLIEGIANLYEQLNNLQIDSFEELEQINADSIYRFGTFEQKRLQITKDYEKLIGAARLAGQQDVAKKLEGERDLEILKETQQYKEFFGDVSEISLKTLENTRKVLLSMMKAAYEAGKITAEQYKQLINDINKQADSAYSGRGIEAIFGNSKGGGFMNMLFGEGDFQSKIDGFKNIFSGAKGDMASMANTSGEVAGNAGEAAEGMQGAAGGAAGTLAIVDAIIKGVYQTLRAVSDTLNVISDYQDSIGHSDASDTLRDWSECINAVNETAMSGWENLKSGNVMGAISDTISMPFKLLTTLNRIHDKHIDKAINRHADAVKDLTNAYNALSHAIDKALGEAVYKNQTAAINNMRQQQAELQEMARLEQDKKKTDWDKVREYNEQYAELGRQIEDMVASITESITQTSAKDLANQLADAITEIYTDGIGNSKEAVEKVTRQIMQNAVKNALKLRFLEGPLQKAIEQLQRDMGFDSEGNGSFDGLTQSEQNRFKNAVATIGANFSEAMKMYEGLFKDLEESTDPTTSLSGAIKGASQESIDLLAGQTNAVRVNQVESIEILRQQLIYLELIASRIGTSNKHLESIDNKIGKDYDPLRSQGLI